MALIWKWGKFTICQRPAHKVRALLWEFIGVKVESSEGKVQALIWKGKEELAVTLSVGDVFMDVVHKYPDITVHFALFNAIISEVFPKDRSIMTFVGFPPPKSPSIISAQPTWKS